jgi:hypothetical protein
MTNSSILSKYIHHAEEPKYKTDILRYSMKKHEWYKYRDCDYVQNLRFMNREFYLAYKNGCYFICTDRGKKDIASVYYRKENENGENVLPGEVVSLFRKEYIRNKVTPEMVDLFLEDPAEYRKTYSKNKPARK